MVKLSKDVIMAKGISALLATIILLIISIGLGAAVMTWGEEFIEEKAEFINAPRGCDLVDFEIITLNNEPVTCYSGYVITSFIENTGSTPFSGVQLQVLGTDDVLDLDIAQDILSGESAKITIPYSDLGKPRQLRISPKTETGLCREASKITPIIECT